MFTKEDLRKFQAESLPDKIQRSFANISSWYARYNNEVYVSFSGGKDSTVLADICAKWCKIVNKPLYLVFVDTGLEYPEIREHVKRFAEYLRQKYGIVVHLEIIRPKMRFDEVVKKYGYPLIGKEAALTIEYASKGSEWALKRINGERKDKTGKKSQFNYAKYKPLVDVDFNISSKCCSVMKKAPAKDYEKKTGKVPIVATMTCESRMRETEWLKTGCNAFDAMRPISAPMSFWTEQDVLLYIKQNDIPLASVYGDIVYADDPDQIRIEEYGVDGCGTEKLQTTGCDRTGCIFCGFGCHGNTLDTEPRFQRLKRTHPRQYNYCIGGGEYNDNGVWQPNKKGLGLGHVFDEINKIYGEGFIKY